MTTMRSVGDAGAGVWQWLLPVLGACLVIGGTWAAGVWLWFTGSEERCRKSEDWLYRVVFGWWGWP